MRFMRILPLTLPLLALWGLAARPAVAASMTYDLTAGELTAVFINGGTNVLDIPSGDTGIAISAASVTVDFAADIGELGLENLFIQVNGPATLMGGSITFENASFSGSGIFIGTSGPEYNYDASGIVNALVNGGAFSTSSISLATSIGLDPDGLHIDLRNVAIGFLEDGTLVTADFSFGARAVNGATAIPEPGSQLLFPAGLALLGWALRFGKAEARS